MLRRFTGKNTGWRNTVFGGFIIALIISAGCTAQNIPQNISSKDASKSTFITDFVTHFSDGDSMTLRDLGRVRLAGVDCPELHQKGGRDAAAFTRHELQNQKVEIEICKEDPKDQYGRSLVFLYYNDHAGKRQLFNRQLLSQGFALVYENTPCLNGRRAEWEADYQSARRNKRGLFATDGEVLDGKIYRRKHPR